MIVVFTGFTASGKTTYLEETIKRNKKFKRLLTYTTRPKRTNEENSKQYLFINNEEFNLMKEEGKIISQRVYKTIENGEPSIWKYGLGVDSIKENEEYLTIVDPTGALSLISYFGQENIKLIYLYCSEEELYKRAAYRGDEPAEFKRRLASDKEQLSKINGYVGLSISTNVDKEEQQKNIEKILEYIGG